MVSLPWFLLFRFIDSILTNWVASMRPAGAATTKIREVFDEAARLFPQQCVVSGQDRAEPEGSERRPSVAPSSQGRTARPRLSRDQPAGVGPDARRRRDYPYPIARHHRMVRGN